MKTSRLIPLITAGTFLTAFGAAQAQSPTPAAAAATSPAACPMCTAKDAHEQHGFGDPMRALTEKLNLSAEQQAQIKPVVAAVLPLIKRIHEEEKAKIDGAMELAVSEVKATLNPEQKVELDQMLARMREHQPMHGHDGPGAFWHHDQGGKPVPSASVAPAQ